MKISRMIGIVLLSLMFCLPSCASTDPVKNDTETPDRSLVAYDISGEIDSPGFRSGQSLPDYSFWKNDYSGKVLSDASKQITFSFDGNMYKGSYCNSTQAYPASYATDFYTIDGGYAKFRHDTGELVSFVQQSPKGNKYSFADCRKKADNFATEIGIDLEDGNWCVKEETLTIGYSFQYFLTVGTIDTFVRMTVTYSPATAQIIQYSSLNLHSVPVSYIFEHSADIERCSDGAETVIRDTLAKDFPDLVSFEILSVNLCVLPDNSVGMVYKLSVIGPDKTYTDGNTGETILLPSKNEVKFLLTVK